MYSIFFQCVQFSLCIRLELNGGLMAGYRGILQKHGHILAQIRGQFLRCFALRMGTREAGNVAPKQPCCRTTLNHGGEICLVLKPPPLVVRVKIPSCPTAFHLTCRCRFRPMRANPYNFHG